MKHKESCGIQVQCYLFWEGGGWREWFLAKATLLQQRLADGSIKLWKTSCLTHDQTSIYFTADMQEAVQKRRVLQRNWKRGMLAETESVLWKHS